MIVLIRIYLVLVDEIRLYRDVEFAGRGMTTPLDRLKSNPHSLRKAIDAMCFQCIFSSAGGGGGWRQQVASCTSDQCALWRVRPAPSSGDDGDGPEGTAEAQNSAICAEAIG